MNHNSRQLLISRAVNKLGDVMYDYGNSAWIASLGGIGQTFLGIYRIAELLVSIIIGPFAGALADRFDRRRILLTTDLLSAITCMTIALLGNQTLMLYGLIAVNVVLALSAIFSRPAYKAFIPEVVPKKDVFRYNSDLETVVQMIKVSSPLLGFLLLQHLGIRLTLLVDSVTFLISFVCVKNIKTTSTEANVKHSASASSVLRDILEGLGYIYKHKDIFFLLLMASLVNFFLAMYEYLLPFTNRLLNQDGIYATMLSLTAVGAITGSLLSRYVKSSLPSMMSMLFLSSIGIIALALPSFFHAPMWLTFLGNLLYKLFEAIFNIHFFSQVQIRVEKAYMGRVFSCIYTIALCLMPIGTFLMTILPNSIQMFSFVWIGLGMALVAFLGLLYTKKLSKHDSLSH